MTALRYGLLGLVIAWIPAGLRSQTDSIPPGRDSVRVIELPDIQSFLLSFGKTKSQIRLDSLSLYRVVTHDELMHYYHEDLADLLWNVSGFYVHDLGSYGKPITVSMNGLGNQNVTFLLNGNVLNESDVAWLNLNQVSLENIDRIEIYRGPATGRYGTGAAAGYVNIVPRQFNADKPLTSLKYRSVFSDFGDVGVYFGRNFGSRFRAYIGGSSKETPGQQFVQGFKGGFIESLQETRYDGGQLFGGFDYLVNDEWAFGFYTMSHRDRFDAYGRNIFGDRNAFGFTTVGGLRTDERTDYHINLRQAAHNQAWENRFLITDIRRGSKNFDQTIIPNSYHSRTIRAESEFYRQFDGHGVTLGVSHEAHDLDGLEEGPRPSDNTRLFIADRFRIGPVNVLPSAGYDFFSNNRHLKSGDLTFIYPVENWKFTVRSGLSERFATPLERYVTSKTSPAADFKKEKLLTFISTAEAVDVVADRISVSIYENRWENGYFYEPASSFPDTASLNLRQKKQGATHGLDLEVEQTLLSIRWTVRQTFFTGDYELRSGLPPYRTWISGFGERKFFNGNLRLTGFLSALYFSTHDGFTFQDAPQAYYVAPRRSHGGWILNTRIVAQIGDFQVFYEAENFPRARFTILDGYDITPQQVRVGMIWILFN